MARPLKKIDWKKASLYAEAQCSLAGIAKRLQVNVSTLKNAIAREFVMEPSEWLDANRIAGKEGVQLAQYLAATQCDQDPRYVKAAIWWGKQHLGQSNQGRFVLEGSENNVVLFKLPDNGRDDRKPIATETDNDDSEDTIH